MPEKDGYEVCEQIKTNPETAHVPVLLLTGAFEPFDQERAARAGYDGSLAKPFEPETLIAKVKDLLARAPVRAAAAPPAPVARPAGPPPAPVVAPAVLPFPRPTPPPAPPAAAPSFIADEPFGRLEEPAPVEPPEGAFAPMTEEESAALLAPPAPAPPAADSASTVLFRAGDLPWNAPPAPAAPPAREPAPAGGTQPALAPPSPPAPEPVFVPESAEAPLEEPAVFEEVLEEDLDFGETSVEPPAGESSSTVLFTPGVATLPPLAPPDADAATGAFEPVKADTAPGPVRPPVLEPEPAFEAEAPVLEPEPRGAAPPRSAGPPVPARPARTESFADVARAVAAPAAPPPAPSEAAAVSVPLEMVEKIAQRVVAQISEKAVREIAWEVIPDLAEALIKQEIERLKAELQKT
jgi:hypothetical protein